MEKQTKMNYRQIFEQANARKAKTGNEKLLNETIIKNRVSNTPKYTDYSISGLLSCKPEATDQAGGVAAFIVEDHYSVANAGIRYSIDFGVIKGKKICRYGFFTVRGGTASESDDKERWYSEVKILEVNGNKVILGLESGRALDIYEVDLKKKDISRIERYNLEAEQREIESKKLQKEAEQEPDFEKQAEKFKEKLESDTEREVETTVFKEKEIAVFRTSQYQYEYDPVIRSLDLYAYKKGWKEPKLVKTLNLRYDDSIRWENKGCSIGAHVDYSKPMKIGDKVKVRLKIEIYYSGDRKYETLKKMETDLTIK